MKIKTKMGTIILVSTPILNFVTLELRIKNNIALADKIQPKIMETYKYKKK